MTNRTIDIARVGRLRALEALAERPQCGRTIRPAPYCSSLLARQPQEDTIECLVERYDNIVALPVRANVPVTMRRLG